MLSARFLWSGGSGIFTKSCVCKSAEGRRYSTSRTTFTAAPPPKNSCCDRTRATPLSSGTEPARRKTLVSQSAPNSFNCSGVCGKTSPKCAPGWLAVMSPTSPATYGPNVLASSSGRPVGAGAPGTTSLPASAGAAGSGSGARRGPSSPPAGTSSSLPPSRRVLAQPRAGPDPETRSKWSRRPSRSSSRTSDPVARRSASAGADVSLPARTRIPPLSPPPTTRQSLGLGACRSLFTTKALPSFRLTLTHPDGGPAPSRSS
mmetsp:Transcript_91302/g.289426  ORF Transcript_91302/g.289426 Transcript_91302/m.289426 type:complete len:260 (-) Transcript_91302:181-960(-)